APEPVAPARPPDLERRDLRSVIDEEVGRLPRKYRTPVVLCYLEGKTQSEAAIELGWTKGTVSGRLARAKYLLRARLARRGLALSVGALGGVLASGALAEAVPPNLLTLTARAPLASATGSAAGPAAALARAVLRDMALARLKIAGVLLLGLGLAS